MNTPRARMWPFFLWLVAFYAVWGSLVIGFEFWPVIQDHWPIATAMAFGSYFAGSTPMGGGTVGFPVLVLLFDMPASLGRDFGLAVQSVGMVSASIYILTARRAVDWALLKPALLGATIGVPFGAAFIAPFVPDLIVKLIFAVTWASFGIIHWLKLRDICAPEGHRTPQPRLDRWLGFALGASGGIVASLTGVGIDMMIYTALVLFYRSDMKIAIPTSVILMAYASLLGTGSNLVLGVIDPTRYGIPAEVLYNWLAAAPVVALGAPFGAIVVNRLPRAPTLLIVSSLCIFQFFWTLVSESVSGLALVGALVGLVVLCWFFLSLFQRGHRRHATPSKPELQAGPATK